MYKYKLKEVAYQPENVRKYQERRIAAFKEIESRINALYPLLDRAKDETISYYQDQPSSYAVVKPTDLVLDYIKDIEEMLKGE